MHLCRHDVGRAEDFQTAIDARLQQEVGILHVALADMQVSHDVVDRDLHRVIIAPMIV